MKSLSSLSVAGAMSIALALSSGALAQECEPSKWGPDDEIGAANYVTPERVLAAIKLVKKGQSHSIIINELALAPGCISCIARNTTGSIPI